MAIINCPECKNKISNTALSCPKCGAPVDLKKIQKTQQNSQLTPGCAWVLFGSITLVIIYFISTFSNMKNDPESLEGNIKLNCAVLAENAIKNELKSPSTAEFSYNGSYKDYVQLTSLIDSTYEVSGFCDAENSFGAKLREEFVVKIKKENGQLTIIDMQTK